MWKDLFVWLLLTIPGLLFAQDAVNVINKKEAERIEKRLSSDEMEGRKAATPGSRKAADFIAAEFKAIGLKPWKDYHDYKEKFVMVQPKLLNARGLMNNEPVDEKNIIVITSSPELRIDHQSGYETVSIKAGLNLFSEASKYISSEKNYLVLVDTGFSKLFNRLAVFKELLFKSGRSVVFVLTAADPKTYEISATHEIAEAEMENVTAVLPGKSKKDEYVIFSAHYDHLGIGKPVNGDSIYNGANDNAAGITAVIMLAKYFKALGNNERTLIFTAFTAEEAGGFGSQYFSRQIDGDRVTAMFNIEMIGTASKWGRNSAFITGYEKSDMGKILSNNLQGTAFTFYPDPYPEQQLFYRSDNATLARSGVPAHTISTSKMDSEEFYHTVNDEIETLDLENMTNIIKAIALSSRSIVNGKAAPSRINTRQLN